MTREEKFRKVAQSITTQEHWDKIMATMPEDLQIDQPVFKARVEIKALPDVPDAAAVTAARLNMQAQVIAALRDENASVKKDLEVTRKQVEERLKR